MSLIDLPSANNVLNAVGTTSAPLFAALYPIALYFTGFVVAGLAITALYGGITWIFHKFAGTDKTSKFD